MKRSELKKVLKPLIKECIKEVIFEEGVLSGLISEVLKGTGTPSRQQKLTENKKPSVNTIYKQVNDNKDYKLKLGESKKKMLDAIGENTYNGVNLFEGTAPLGRAGSTGESAASSPLDTYAPTDSGVDISSLFSPNWKSLI